MNNQMVAALQAQIRSLLIDALEELGAPESGNADHGAIIAAERIIAQAAAVATGYRAITAKPGHF